MNLNLNQFKRKGLYLILDNSTKIAFTDDNIKKITHDFWTNKISNDIKKSIEFQKCAFCPLKENNDLCDAIKPILPLIEVVKRYNSYDKTIAVYTNDKNIIHVSHTTMQEALKYLSMISLFNYCEVGKLYKKYFYGINPLSTPAEISKKLYINAFWINKNLTASKKSIKELKKTVLTISRNQIKRINLICKKDSLINAYVNTHTAIDLISIDIEEEIVSAIDNIESEHNYF